MLNLDCVSDMIVSKFGYAPTEEQLAIIECSLTGKDIIVSSYSGASKTSTMMMLSLVQHENGKKGIYLAYNKAIADESRGKFPVSVDCRTIHSLAFGQLPNNLKRKIKYKNLSFKDAQYRYGLSAQFVKDEVGREKVISVGNMWMMTKNTVAQFCKSLDKEITSKHVERSKLDWMKVKELNLYKVNEIILHAAKMYWKDIISPKSDVPMTHDGYLKLLTFSDFRLDYDYIMVDEAQDLNPVMIEILQKCDKQKILVGDSYQNIYAWNNTVNVFNRNISDKVMKQGYETLYLTKAFRFGKCVEDLANLILSYRGAEKVLVGNGSTDGKSYLISDKKTKGEKKEYSFAKAKSVICRTNSGVVSAIFAYKGCYPDRHIYTTADLDDVRRFIFSLKSLRNGDKAGNKHRLLVAFDDWDEFSEYMADEDNVEDDIKRLYKLVSHHGESAVLDICYSCKIQDGSDVTITTAHKSKGLEWDSVYLWNDYMFESSKIEDEQDGQCYEVLICNEQELNLMYVAATRAKKDIYASNWFTFFDLLRHKGKKLVAKIDNE